ncbi:hypothetical protein N431DRAFT_430392 [Stipitochalara longipes BDJ]|nr:hypothetical protein N431DRAFT_430392 [Stipitochalara longipes BDJ]
MQTKDNENALQGTNLRLITRPTNCFNPDKFAMPAEASTFTTPDNHHFYSKHRYKQLDPKAQEVRLLKIHPQRLQVQELAIVFPEWIKQDNTDAA